MSNFPSRPTTALPGSVFINKIGNLGASSQRDDLIVKEIISGNFPNFLRNLAPITIKEGNNILTYKVIPDYLSVGSDDDYIRVPLGGPAAQKIADAFDCILPTPKISDQIWKNAKVKLAPAPLSNKSKVDIGDKTYTQSQFLSGKMQDTDTFKYHNQVIQNQLSKYNPGDLVAGHKKDVVISKDREKGKLGLYGLHDESGKPIQSSLSPHTANYSDYSSGIRLVDRKAVLNGNQVDLIDILSNPQLAGLISNKGAMTNFSYKEDQSAPKSQNKQTVNQDSDAYEEIFKKINEYLKKLNII